MSNTKKIKVKNIVFSALSVIIIIAILLSLLPILSDLATQQGRDNFKEILTSFGVYGWFIFLAIQIAQVIFAFIPGEPVEIMAGFMYGGFGGLLTCLLGIFIGTCAIYYMVDMFANKNSRKQNVEQKLGKYKFLQKEKSLKLLVFFLFLIPGTPKDTLIYIAPFLKIKPLSFIAIATLARIPSIITSTFAGSTIQSGDFNASVILFIVAGALGVLGIFANDKIIKHKNKNKCQN
ncbi:MAG: TVP38/TMEM64 family protein [Oscillospiraceae bacterium]|nr:TVP38/TMEM64 family protein [Oscillospiraceae bacterium]